MQTIANDVRWLREVMHGGRVIVLGDNSTWEVAPKNVEDTWFWDLVSRIDVTVGDNPSYPYKLLNRDNNEIIEAKLLIRKVH